MVRAALPVAIALATLSAASTAAGQEAKGSIRYTFGTLLVPNELGDRSLVIEKRESWFTGKAVPARAVVVSEAVDVSDDRFDLPKGAVLSVATSPYFVACRGVGARTCLVDMDQDGVLDAWFKPSVDVLWNRFAGHIQRDDIFPITPVGATVLSSDDLKSLKQWGVFFVRYERGMLTFCTSEAGDYSQCLTEAPKIKPSEIEQTVEFMGGLYSYRKLEDGKLAIEIRRDPTEMLF